MRHSCYSSLLCFCFFQIFEQIAFLPDNSSVVPFAWLLVMTKTKRSSDDHRDLLLCPVTNQRVTKHTLRRWTGWEGGRVAARWQRCLLMKIKSGEEEWGVGGEGGSREMRVFVFKEEIGWPGIFLASAITVVSVATIAQKYKGPLWGWEVIVGYMLLGYVCIRKRKRDRIPQHRCLVF